MIENAPMDLLHSERKNGTNSIISRPKECHKSKQILTNLAVFQQTRNINRVTCINDKQLHGSWGVPPSLPQDQVDTFQAHHQQKNFHCSLQYRHNSKRATAYLPQMSFDRSDKIRHLLRVGFGNHSLMFRFLTTTLKPWWTKRKSLY